METFLLVTFKIKNFSIDPHEENFQTINCCTIFPSNSAEKIVKKEINLQFRICIYEKWCEIVVNLKQKIYVTLEYNICNGLDFIINFLKLKC